MMVGFVMEACPVVRGPGDEWIVLAKTREILEGHLVATVELGRDWKQI